MDRTYIAILGFFAGLMMDCIVGAGMATLQTAALTDLISRGDGDLFRLAEAVTPYALLAMVALPVSGAGLGWAVGGGRRG